MLHLFLDQAVWERLNSYTSKVNNATKLSQEQFWLKNIYKKKRNIFFLQTNDQQDLAEWVKVLKNAIKTIMTGSQT